VLVDQPDNQGDEHDEDQSDEDEGTGATYKRGYATGI